MLIKCEIFTLQFLNRRPISSCKVAPLNAVESSLDEVCNYEACRPRSNRNVMEESKYKCMDNVEKENYFSYGNENVCIKQLSCTGDDYIEERRSIHSNPLPSISMNDVDFSSCKEVRI